MATLQDFNSLVSAMDAETNRLAQKIQDLLTQIGAGGLAAADEDAVLASLTAIRDRLAALGQDPVNPIPTP